MSDSMLVFLFLAIVFAPCAIAFLSSTTAGSSDEFYLDKPSDPRPGAPDSLVRQAMRAEMELSEDFEIRSFPKGLSQRRLLLRDTESGVKLSIAQLREAAVELVKQGGQALVHELALVAAAMVAAGRTVSDAAREALTAARNAYAWFAWTDSQEQRGGDAWAEAPPPIELHLDVAEEPRWREATQAA